MSDPDLLEQFNELKLELEDRVDTFLCALCGSAMPQSGFFFSEGKPLPCVDPFCPALFRLNFEIEIALDCAILLGLGVIGELPQRPLRWTPLSHANFRMMLALY